MDEFSLIRISRMIESHKKAHGRDISEGELRAQHVSPGELDYLVRRGMVDKYQVTSGKGAAENRFKLHRDWRSLREP